MDRLKAKNKVSPNSEVNSYLLGKQSDGEHVEGTLRVFYAHRSLRMDITIVEVQKSTCSFGSHQITRCEAHEPNN